jgi:hypothetical protein
MTSRSFSDMTASLCIEGFRAWVTDDRARLEKRNCDFGGCENAEVNPHYRIKRALLARPPRPMMSTFPFFACFARFSRSGVDASHPNKKTAGIDRRSFRWQLGLMRSTLL